MMVEYASAQLVHVLSTRFGGCSYNVAAEIKDILERDRERVFCYNPNRDNLVLEGGLTQVANSVWLKRWRFFLARAKITSGTVVQVVSDTEGLSDMQDAEASMAEREAVPVKRVAFPDVSPVAQQLATHGLCSGRT